MGVGKKFVLSVAAAAVVFGGGMGLFAGDGTAHAETRGCSYQQYIAWFNSAPPYNPVTKTRDPLLFAAWWDARYCG